MLAPYRLGERKPKILDFDIEVRPLAFYGGDQVTKQVTAIAWAWAEDDPYIESRLLGDPIQVGETSDGLGIYRTATVDDLLDEFIPVLLSADVVTGHFIRGFDLPVLNAQLLRLRRPGLPTLTTEDTKGDLDKMSGISKSQENLGATLGTPAPKVGMNTAAWEAGNTLTREGRDLVRERVEGDVSQHLQLRRELIEAGFLGRTRAWTPRSTTKGYQP